MKPDGQIRVDAGGSLNDKNISWGELLLGLALLALGLLVLLDGMGQPDSTSASGIGAGFFPVIVGVALILVSALLVVEVLRGKHAQPEDSEGDIDTSKMATWQFLLVGGAVVLFMFGINRLGYTLSSAITFWLVAFAMGARRHFRSAVIALVLSVSVYLLFTQVLRIDLPAGVLGGVL